MRAFFLAVSLWHVLVSHGFNSVTRTRRSMSSTPCTPRRFLKSSALASTVDATQSAVPTESTNPDDPIKTDAVICGGGPAGLLSAIMLAKKFPTQKIKVFDRLSSPPSPTDEAVWNDVAKFYLIGLGSRGQKALGQFGVWEEVEASCTAVLGRKDWAPGSDEGVERIFTDRPVDTQVLPRDKLVGVLYNHIMSNYADAVELNYGYEVTPVNFDADGGSAVLVRVSKCDDVTLERVNPTAVENDSGNELDTLCDPENSYLVSTGFLVAADGTARSVANQMEQHDKEKFESMNPVSRLFAEKPFRVKRYVDDNQRIYKTVPLRLPSDWRPDLNYSARTKEGRVTFDALPANDKRSYCGVLLLKKDDPLAQSNSDPNELRALLNEALPQFSELLDDDTVEQIAKKPPSFLPAFRYVGPRLNQGGRTIILGDCAHTVKPYFGLGANTALEDVKCLGDAMETSGGDIPNAVKQFSDERAGEAETVVRLSRELDRPGALGFVTFILPLILDSIFNRLAPKLFAPNTIAMLQREGYTFCRVARRKRQDRILQVAVLATTLATMSLAMRAIVKSLAAALGKGSTTVVAGMGAMGVTAVFLKKIAAYLVPGMAPADVLNKTKSKISDSERAGSFFFGKTGKKKRASKPQR